MKKIFTLLLVALLPTLAIAHDAYINGIYYNISGNEAIVTYHDYNIQNSYSGSVVIPSSITYSRKTYNVSSIGENAFHYCSGLTSITIPNSVTSIGDNAFRGCGGLTSINIPNSMTSIGNNVFEKCNSLTSITIPNSVISIGDDAFMDCSSLTSVTIGKGVTSIGGDAFYNCEKLGAVYISDISAWCKIKFNSNSIKPFNWSNSSNPLYYAHNLYLNRQEIKSLIIPGNVTNIGEIAFCYCTGLTSVIINSGVTSIGQSAFMGCSNLTFVNIPSSVTSIKGHAFQSCSRLTTITIPNSVTSIGEYAFENCTGLTSITIPNSVTYIEDYVFSGCKNLSSVVIPNSVTNIGYHSFADCYHLESITIPSSVYYIANQAFYCSYLKSVKMERTTPISIYSNSFYYPSSTTLYVPLGSKSAYENVSYWRDFKEIIEYADDEIYIEDAEAMTGRQMVLPISLKNKHRITGLQMDLYLPEGVTVATNSRGKMVVSVTGRMDGNYSLSGKEMEGGFIRITGFSPDNDAFVGNDGVILNVTLNIADNMAGGDYVVQLKDIVLSDVNNMEHPTLDVEATIKIHALGDADGSGIVNINDVVCIVNHILNRETGTFLKTLADVDGNGSININDVVVLIDRYILHRNNAPLCALRMKAEATETTDHLYLDDFYMVAGDTVEIAVKLSNTHDVRAVQGNIKLPDGFSFVTKSNGRLDVKNLNDRSEDFTLSCALQSDSSMTFTHYSIDGYAYEGCDGGIFTFRIAADTSIPTNTYNMSLTGVVLSIEGIAYEQPDFYSSILADGITSITATDARRSYYYDFNGRKLVAPQKGINIIHYSDGTCKKVLLK